MGRTLSILAIGYRVRSHRGTQFRQWATARLNEYLLKNFSPRCKTKCIGLRMATRLLS
ncbi:MAG: virulence RhuM family protein [Cystobacterineae bacterium]|nr:virulence RhuM family protein [Cystobacterineae bacterium]